MAYELRLLTKEDDRTRFRSTNEALNRFFAGYAAQNQFRHRVSATYVCVEPDAGVVAYMTVTAATIRADALRRAGERGYPPYPLPAFKVARLATADGFEGRGYASALLRRALELAVAMSLQMGCVGVLTDAKPESVDWYRKRDFVRLETEHALGSDEVSTDDDAEPREMFLSMRKVVEAMNEP